MKICTKCKNSKDLTYFYKNRNNKDGLSIWCKECSKAIQKKYYQSSKRKVTYKKYYQSAKGKRYKRNNHYLKCYGITLENKYEMYRKQEGKCLICKNWYKTLCVDHDYKTGEVRGLLCYSCNSGLALFKENKAIFINAMEYLGLDT